MTDLRRTSSILTAVAMLAAICLAVPAAAEGATRPGEDGLVDRGGDGRVAPGRSDGLADVLWTVVALAAVAAMIFVLRAVLKRIGPGARLASGQGVMEVLARTPMGPKHTLAVVRFGQRLVLVGVSGDRMAALAEVADPIEAANILQSLGGPDASGPGGQGAGAGVSQQQQAPGRQAGGDRTS